MKNGFTLIELLAVIVILAIIALIAVPIVLNIINDAKKSSQEESFKLYGKAIENGVANYLMKNPTAKPETLTMEDIKDYVKYSGGEKIECETFQINEKGKIYLANCSINNTKVEYTYGEKQRDPNITVDLIQGLTPVVYDGNNWKVVDKNDPNWYNYDEQKWANAVVLGDVTKQVGDTVAVDGTEAKMMLVWIPRYEYKIEGDFGKGGQSAELPGEIEVNFIGKNKTTPSEGYILHPAFNFDGEKNGFWVGKFELSHETLSSNTTDNNLGCSSTSCANASGLRILPNKESLRYNKVSNFWYAIKSIENTSSFGLTNIDTHMMKNSEWGAVAYLSQSKYGKYGNSDYEGAQKEVYINNSSSFYTGRSGGNKGGNTARKDTYTDQTSTTQYINYGYYTYDGYLLSYDTNNKTETRDINKGAGASTTGNIYGVYDMSGGSYEYVMGAYGDSQGIYSGYSAYGNSGFNGRTGNDNGNVTNGAQVPDSKYYDKYTNSTNSSSNDGSESCNNGKCLGHAMSETASWYGDFAYMVTSNSSWFVRGGYYLSKTVAGVFSRVYSYGSSSRSNSARVVGFGK